MKYLAVFLLAVAFALPMLAQTTVDVFFVNDSSDDVSLFSVRPTGVTETNLLTVTLAPNQSIYLDIDIPLGLDWDYSVFKDQGGGGGVGNSGTLLDPHPNALVSNGIATIYTSYMDSSQPWPAWTGDPGSSQKSSSGGGEDANCSTSTDGGAGLLALLGIIFAFSIGRLAKTG